MPKRIIRDLQSFNECKASYHLIPKIAEHLTKKLQKKSPPNETASYFGYCQACGKLRHFNYDWVFSPQKEFVDFRESLFCARCHLNNRMRGLAGYFLNDIKGKKDQIIYAHEFITPFFRRIKKTLRKTNHTLIGSEFISPAHKSGEIVDGIRHEDATDSSFANESLDYILSADVYEHIPHVDRAFSEAFRTLRKNGKLYFTVPFDLSQEKTVTRATVENGQLVHIKEPAYHYNPVDPAGGSLVFSDFGWDIIPALKKAGFSEAYALPIMSAKYGNISFEPIILFVGEK